MVVGGDGGGNGESAYETSPPLFFQNWEEGEAPSQSNPSINHYFIKHLTPPKTYNLSMFLINN